MKALVYDGPETLGFRDVADPVPGAGDVLVKVDSVGICGSDMHAYLGHDDRRPAPLILGHEASGHIVGGARDGERVTLNPLVGCGQCEACQSGQNNLCPQRQIISLPPAEGAFAQFVKIAEANVVTVPDHVSLEKASLAEPIACGWHAVRLATKSIGDMDRPLKALVLGGGAIGVGAAMCLRQRGIEDITLADPNTDRCEYLRATCALNAIAPDDLPQDAQFDIVIDGVGFAATRATASAFARPGGVIAHIGLGSGEGGLDVRRMTLQEITFIGTYTYTPQDFRDTAAAIFDGSLGALDWIEARPLSAGAQSFVDIRAATVLAPKIILKPWG